MSVEELLSKWRNIKNEIALLQKKEQKIKDYIHNFMNTHNVNSLTSDSFKCTRTVVSKKGMTKKNTPPEVWMQYAQENRYPMLTLKKI